MNTYDYNQKLIEREKMAEVRRFKRPPESLGNKKKRYSEDTELMKKTKREINNINNAVDTILISMCELNDNKYALSLGCDNAEQLLRGHINLTSNHINSLLKLSKMKIKLVSKWDIDDLVVLDFFRLLNCEDLTNTTLKIIEKENQTVDIETVINTIKRIHVENLTSFQIREGLLARFCKNKYVKPTRPNNCTSHQSNEDIHIKFEIKLNSSFGKRKRSIKERMGYHLKLI